MPFSLLTLVVSAAGVPAANGASCLPARACYTLPTLSPRGPAATQSSQRDPPDALA